MSIPTTKYIKKKNMKSFYKYIFHETGDECRCGCGGVALVTHVPEKIVGPRVLLWLQGVGLWPNKLKAVL